MKSLKLSAHDPGSDILTTILLSGNLRDDEMIDQIINFLAAVVSSLYPYTRRQLRVVGLTLPLSNISG
jgi:hypothetical protein